MYSRHVLFQVIDSLCTPEETRHEERQQALLELLHAGGLTHTDHDQLVLLARKAHLLVSVQWNAFIMAIFCANLNCLL